MEQKLAFENEQPGNRLRAVARTPALPTRVVVRSRSLLNLPEALGSQEHQPERRHEGQEHLKKALLLKPFISITSTFHLQSLLQAIINLHNTFAS